MKIKIIEGENLRQLEYEVNEFIKDKCVINIKYELNEYRTCDGIETVLMVMILYDYYDRCGYLDKKTIMDFRKCRID